MWIVRIECGGMDLLGSYLAALLAAPGAELPLVSISFGPDDLFSTFERSPIGGT